MKSIGFQGPFEVEHHDFILMPICSVGKNFATVFAGTGRAKSRVLWKLLTLILLPPNLFHISSLLLSLMLRLRGFPSEFPSIQA